MSIQHEFDSLIISGGNEGNKGKIAHWNLKYYDLATRITYVHMSGGTYSLKLTPNNRFLRNFSWQFYLRDFLPEICWEAASEEILF